MSHPSASVAVRPVPVVLGRAVLAARSVWAVWRSAVVVALVGVVALAGRLSVPARRRAVPQPPVPTADPAVLVTTLSHEIRTPLNAVIGLCDLLLSGPVDAGQREQVRQVRRSGMLILGLVNDTLDRAALDADELVVNRQPFALAELLTDVVELLQVDADAKGLVLRTVVGPGCPEQVRGDAPRIRQVLVNLVGNAVKFTARGVVTIEIDGTDRDGVLRFRVTDTGTGIPADELGRIFRPYARVVRDRQPGPSGAGLGLSISQDLVRGMGGDITVTSNEGVGSDFGFELLLPAEPSRVPVAQAPTGRPVTVLERQPDRGGRTAERPLRILLAEDDPTSRQVCMLLLRQLGHGVDVVADGAAAVAAFASSAYDLVLLDSQMPGLDGVDAARAIRASEDPGDAVRVVALTGSVTAADQVAYVEAGMDGLLAKPVNRAGLVRTLADVPRRPVVAAPGETAPGVGSLSVLPLAG